jgi:hypothetical protein
MLMSRVVMDCGHMALTDMYRGICMAEKVSPLIIKRDMVKQVADVFTEAFQNDPLLSWIIPEDLSRRSLLPLFFNFRVLHGLRYGEVHATSPNVEGAAICLPHTQTNMTRWKMLLNGAMSFSRKADQVTLQRLQAFGAYADELHHQYTPFPHRILFLIGVRPELQGQGYAPTTSELDV